MFKQQCRAERWKILNVFVVCNSLDKRQFLTLKLCSMRPSVLNPFVRAAGWQCVRALQLHIPFKLTFRLTNLIEFYEVVSTPGEIKLSK